MTAVAEDLPVISRHERRLHSVTGHRRSDTAYGNSGSIEASQAGCDSPGNRMRLPSQPTERTDTGWAAHRRPRLIDFRQADFVSPLALGLVHGTVGTAEDGLAV